MNELLNVNEQKIEDMIYEIRGKQVMLDRDLAFLYNVETKVLNQNVKRNKNKFLEGTCFQMSNSEFMNWRSQFVTSNNDKMGLRRPPYVFTEQGIEILSIILKSKSILQINSSIMEVFSKIKKDFSLHDNDLSFENQREISDMIYEIRGKQVMLDTDLARLYQCKNGAKTINLAVRRHMNRFPKRFMFRLTWEEVKGLCSRFQLETLNNKSDRDQNIKYLPYAFTEQGVAMLATVLRTSVAEEVSIQIMDAFVLMKKYISSDLLEQRYFKNMLYVIRRS